MIFAGALSSSGIVNIDTGAGNDQLDFQDDVTATAAATINLGDGVNQFDLAASKTLSASELSLTSGADADDLDIKGLVLANVIAIDSGADNDTISITGTLRDTDSLSDADVGIITITGGADNDVITLSAQEITGRAQITGASGNDDLSVIRLHTRVEDLDLDGGEGQDDYFIQTTNVDINGADADYVINVNDTGTDANHYDQLVVDGTSTEDLFLIRENYIARMHGNSLDYFNNPNVERINYNGSINGNPTPLQAGDPESDITISGVIINTYAGNDEIFFDDTGTTFTVNAGDDKDTFQVGQVFGELPTNLSEPGDTIQTTNVTSGYLSYGTSHTVTLNGGDEIGAGDQFSVYSNKGLLFLNGGDGDDNFELRAFLIAGSALSSVDGGTGDNTIEYNLNAKVKIDGGAGTDKVTLIGTEADDVVLLNDEGFFGAGVSADIVNVEFIELDLLQGNDTFYIQGSEAGVIYTLIGGTGSDDFIVTGDVLLPVAVKDGIVLNKSIGTLEGDIIIEGGNAERDRSLRIAVMLPEETPTVPLYIGDPTREYSHTDRLTIFRDHTSNDEAVTIAATPTGPGAVLAASGMTQVVGIDQATIDYAGIDIVEVLLGEGNDELDIDITPHSITTAFDLVGGDTLKNVGGEWFEAGYRVGDTIFISGSNSGAGNSYDGSYSIAAMSSDGATITLEGAAFASNETLSFTVTRALPLMLMHGGGNQALANGEMGGDTITVTGSGYVGNNSVPLIVFGDTTQDGSRYNDDAVNPSSPSARAFANAGNDVIDASAATAGIVIYGGAGDDTLTGSQVNDIVLGGSGSDTLFGLTGSDHLYGDSGLNINVDIDNFNQRASQVEGYGPVEIAGRISLRIDASQNIMDVITVDESTHANKDLLTVGGDDITTGSGNDIAFGDHGVIERITNNYPNDFLLFSTDNVNRIYSTVNSVGGDDTINASSGDNRLVGGDGSDTINASNGNDLVIGDNGEINFDAAGIITDIQSTSTDQGGADFITLIAGNNTVIAGFGSDEVTTGKGADDVIGDNGIIQYVDGVAVRLSTNDNDVSTTGVDTIIVGGGDNRVLAGLSNDEVTSTYGNDVVLGDNGELSYINNVLVNATSSEASLGGADTLSLGEGNNIVIAGAGVDTITTTDGVDIILGDNGQLVWSVTGIIESVTATDLTNGAGDIIKAGDATILLLAQRVMMLLKPVSITIRF